MWNWSLLLKPTFNSKKGGSLNNSAFCLLIRPEHCLTFCVTLETSDYRVLFRALHTIYRLGGSVDNSCFGGIQLVLLNLERRHWLRMGMRMPVLTVRFEVLG